MRLLARDADTRLGACLGPSEPLPYALDYRSCGRELLHTLGVMVAVMLVFLLPALAAVLTASRFGVDTAIDLNALAIVILSGRGYLAFWLLFEPQGWRHLQPYFCWRLCPCRRRICGF